MQHILEEVDTQQKSFILTEADPAAMTGNKKPTTMQVNQEIANVGWKKLYDNCSTKEDFAKFWDTYFRKEWGEVANVHGKARKLGDAFKDELINLGFDEILNPFINYLKDNNKERLNWFTMESYTALHNAIVNHLVTLNDIKGKGKFGKDNLVFNKMLFSRSVSEITDYLRAQNQLLDDGQKFIAMAKLSYWDVSDVGRGIILKNIMLKGGVIQPTQNLDLSLAAYKDNGPTPLNKTLDIAIAELAPILKIKQVLEILFGAELGTKKILTNDEIENKLAKTGIDGNPTEAKKLLAFLALTFYVNYNQVFTSVNTKTNNKLDSIIKDPAQTAGTRDNWAKWTKDLSLTAAYTPQQVEYLLTLVIKEAAAAAV